jgi:hypothetical protein
LRREARTERRAARLAVLEKALEATGRAVDRVVAYMNGEVFESEAGPLERIADPAEALVRLNRSLRQIAALADKLDESDEARETRLKEEAEAREAAKRRAEERRRRAPEDALRERKKRAIRYAARNALRDDEPDLDREERERLLDDLFTDYENYDDYSGDPVVILVELCRELGLTLE